MSDLQHAFVTATQLHTTGRLDEAEAAYRAILAADPTHVQSLHLTGVIASQRGQHPTAIELIGRAIALAGQNAPASFHNNIGLAYRAAGQLDNAVAHFRQATAIRPDYAEAFCNLGIIYREQGRLDQAAECYKRALTIRPDDAETHNSFGNLFKDKGSLDGAEAYFRRALALKPGYADAHSNLGGVLWELGRLEEAAANCRRAIALKPGDAEAHNNLSNVLREQGKLDEAMACCHRAIALQPSHTGAHWNEALLNLLRGEFPAGWRQYEWRWQRPETPPRHFAEPAWDGEDISGRTILLYAEQGHGDTIQFIRYAPLVKERGAKVIVECQPELKRLLESASGIDALVARDAKLPPFDCHAALLSLPRLLNTTLETIPAHIPYLEPRADLVEAWRSRLPDRSGTRAGIVWRGNPGHKNDRKRSIPVRYFADLCAAPGVDWISLQKDATGEEIAALSPNGRIRDFGPQLNDWADTAALISTLDLVVTVDTAIAHLAGALGKPVWILLPADPDWRWLLSRGDSPWYPSARLFRQASPGDWTSAFAEIHKALNAVS